MSIKEFATLHYGKSPSTYGTVVCLAALGCAAFAIGGYTWQSAINYPRKEIKEETKMSQDTLKKINAKFKGVKLIIFDEIGMISARQLRIFEYRLIFEYGVESQLEKDLINSKPFGGIHIVFGGDFWQLGPIACHDPLYKEPNPDKQDRWTLEGDALWAQSRKLSI